MSASKKPLDKNDDFETSVGIVRDVVAWFRRRGHKSDRAIVEAARPLDISPDLAWRLNYRAKIWAVPAVLRRHLEERFVVAIDQEIAELEFQTEQLRMRQNQMKLMLSQERRGTRCRNGVGLSSRDTGHSGGERRSCAAI